MVGSLVAGFQKFSRENLWIYLLLAIAFIIVLVTGKGNLYEIVFLFTLNLIANLCAILMQDSYKNQDMGTGAVFLMIANTLYTLLALYGYFINGEPQYLLWQTSFILTGLKAVALYKFDTDIKWINPWSMWALNTLLLYISFFVLDIPWYGLIQSVGFCFVTIGLVMTNDIYRYFTILLGTTFLVTGNLLWIMSNYNSGYILWITLSYFLLVLSTFVFYLKLFFVYLERFKRL